MICQMVSEKLNTSTDQSIRYGGTGCISPNHTLSSPNFQGYWSSGNRSGHGVMFYSDNTNYMGRWVNDKRSGYGVLRNNLEGWRFLSLWKEDKKHGRGIFIRFVSEIRSMVVYVSFSDEQFLPKLSLDWDKVLTNRFLHRISGCRLYLGKIMIFPEEVDGVVRKF